MVHVEDMAAMTIKDIPPDLFQRFKAYAALQGKTYREVIIEFMEQKAKQVRLDPGKN